MLEIAETEKEVRTKAFADKLNDLRANKSEKTCDKKSDKLDKKIAKTPGEETKDGQAHQFASKLASLRNNKKGEKKMRAVAKRIGKIDPKTKEFIEKRSCDGKFQA